MAMRLSDAGLDATRIVGPFLSRNTCLTFTSQSKLLDLREVPQILIEAD